MNLLSLYQIASNLTRSDSKAENASDMAWEKSRNADTPKDHAKAAEAHKDAAMAHAKAGDMHSAEMHSKMAAMHGEHSEPDEDDA